MKKITFILISLGLFFTTMLNFVYAVNDNEDNIRNIQQTDGIILDNNLKEKSMPSIVYNILSKYSSPTPMQITLPCVLIERESCKELEN